MYLCTLFKNRPTMIKSMTGFGRTTIETEDKSERYNAGEYAD